MKTIPLTKNQVAYVDDEDYDYLMKFTWWFSRGGYACTTVYKNGIKRNLYMHRMILKPKKGLFSDHINGDKLDNRKCNLRVCTTAENMRNRGKQRNNTSGFKGVFRSLCSPKWRSQITVNRKAIHLGLFETKEEACSAYNLAAKAYFGDYAKLEAS